MVYFSPMQRMNRLARQIDRTIANALGYDLFRPPTANVRDEPLLGPSQIDMTEKPEQLSLLGGLDSTGVLQLPSMRCDVQEDTDKYVVSAELPGIPKNSIQLEIKDHVLIIGGEKKHEHSEIENGGEGKTDANKIEHKNKTDNKSSNGSGKRKNEASSEPQHRIRRYERSYGHFERRFVLPDDVDEDKIAANYNDGVLRITLPRVPRPNKSTGRRLEIQ